MPREGGWLPASRDWHVAGIVRPALVALVTCDAAHGDRIQRGRGVEQGGARTGQVVRVLGPPVAGTVLVAAVVPRGNDEQYVELAAECIECHRQSRHVPALVGLVQIAAGQIEDSTTVVLDEVPHRPLDLVLDQVAVALVALVQNPPAEKPQLGDEAPPSKTVGHVIVESDARDERAVPVLIGNRRIGQKALSVAHGGGEQRVARNDAGIEDRDPRSTVGRGLGRPEPVDVRGHQRPLQADTRREIHRANVAMTKQVVGQRPRAPNSVHRQMGLPHGVENRAILFGDPALERAPQFLCLVGSFQGPYLGIQYEGLVIGHSVAAQSPAGSIFRSPAVEVLQCVQHVAVQDMFIGSQTREPGLERIELRLAAERQEQRIRLLTDHVNVAGGSRHILGRHLVGQRDLDQTALVVTADVRRGGCITRGLQTLAEQSGVSLWIVWWCGRRKAAPGSPFGNGLLPGQLQMRVTAAGFVRHQLGVP